MPSSVNDLFASGCGRVGVAPWGKQVPSTNPGVYVVALVGDTDAHAILDRPPLSVTEMVRLIGEGICVDGKPADASTLARRFEQMWLPGEPVLYTGRTTSTARRLREFYRTRPGDRGPHRGGWFIKVLEPERLWLHWCECDDAADMERRMLERFAAGVSSESRHRLIDPERPYPFANLTGPLGPKRHGISWCSEQGEGEVGGVRVPRRPPPSWGGGRAALRQLIGDLHGEEIRTLAQGRPNWIVRRDDEHVWVETLRSRSQGTGPQRVPIAWLEDAYATLVERGVLRAEDLGPRASKRSSFILALLAQLDDVEVSVAPVELRTRE